MYQGCTLFWLPYPAEFLAFGTQEVLQEAFFRLVYRLSTVRSKLQLGVEI
jgi:hypothetical protein